MNTRNNNNNNNPQPPLSSNNSQRPQQTPVGLPIRSTALISQLSRQFHTNNTLSSDDISKINNFITSNAQQRQPQRNVSSLVPTNETTTTTTTTTSSSDAIPHFEINDSQNHSEVKNKRKISENEDSELSTQENDSSNEKRTKVVTIPSLEYTSLNLDFSDIPYGIPVPSTSSSIAVTVPVQVAPIQDINDNNTDGPSRDMQEDTLHSSMHASGSHSLNIPMVSSFKLCDTNGNNLNSNDETILIYNKHYHCNSFSKLDGTKIIFKLNHEKNSFLATHCGDASRTKHVLSKAAGFVVAETGASIMVKEYYTIKTSTGTLDFDFDSNASPRLLLNRFKASSREEFEKLIYKDTNQVVTNGTRLIYRNNKLLSEEGQQKIISARKLRKTNAKIRKTEKNPTNNNNADEVDNTDSPSSPTALTSQVVPIFNTATPINSRVEVATQEEISSQVEISSDEENSNNPAHDTEGDKTIDHESNEKPNLDVIDVSGRFDLCDTNGNPINDETILIYKKSYHCIHFKLDNSKIVYRLDYQKQSYVSQHYLDAGVKNYELKKNDCFVDAETGYTIVPAECFSIETNKMNGGFKAKLFFHITKDGPKLLLNRFQAKDRERSSKLCIKETGKKVKHHAEIIYADSKLFLKNGRKQLVRVRAVIKDCKISKSNKKTANTDINNNNNNNNNPNTQQTINTPIATLNTANILPIVGNSSSPTQTSSNLFQPQAVAQQKATASPPEPFQNLTPPQP